MGGTIQKEQKLKLIEMKGIERIYPCGGSQIHALMNINLDIFQGEFIGIMGPSASGKSTLLNIIGCLDSPAAGTYLLSGNNINDLSRNEKASIRNKVFGFVFQSFNLLPELDIASNVALPLKYSDTPKYQWKDKVREALASVGLEGIEERYPDQLSGGQQQRVSIARALVNDPAIILADEPTGNLDSVTGQGIMEEFRKLNILTQKTIIVITHDSRIAGYADRLITLEDGSIDADIRLDAAQQRESTLINPFGEIDQEGTAYEDIL